MVECNSDIKVASMVWGAVHELHQAQADEIASLGFQHVFFESSDSIPWATDIIVVQGPYGTLAHLVNQLKPMPLKSRPVLVYWFQQSLQFLSPSLITLPTSRLFSDLSWSHQGRRVESLSLVTRGGKPSWLKGKRLGFLGDIVWLHKNGLLDLLVLSSTFYADYLDQWGIPSMLVPRGYSPRYGEAVEQYRDIAAIWMGKTRTRRRRALVYGLQSELKSKGYTMQVYDGAENGFIYGAERTALLNRTRFVLNANFSGPTDELSIRYYIAAANGAVILREPNANQYPFVPGVHLIECLPSDMVDVVDYYSEHPEELRQIADNALELVTKELTLAEVISAILQRASYVLASRRPDGPKMPAEPKNSQ